VPSVHPIGRSRGPLGTGQRCAGITEGSIRSPDRALDLLFCVGIAGFRLNTALASYLRERAADPDHAPEAEPEQPSSTVQRWRLVDRLTEKQITDLITAFVGGTAKHVLADQYGVSLTAVKSLLRSRGIQGKNRGGRRERRNG
jgi:hypothetical protein